MSADDLAFDYTRPLAGTVLTTKLYMFTKHNLGYYQVMKDIFLDLIFSKLAESITQKMASQVLSTYTSIMSAYPIPILFRQHKVKTPPHPTP